MVLLSGLAYYTGPPFTCHGADTVRLVPKWAYPCCDVPPKHRHRCRVFPSIVGLLQELDVTNLVIYRTYALGDVLMLLPILGALRRHIDVDLKILLVVGFLIDRNLGGLRIPWLRFTNNRGVTDYGGDVHITLNSVLEIDHRGGEASDTHRLDLYAKAMGITLEYSYEAQPCST